MLDCRQAVIISVRMTSESCESVTVTGPENGAVTVIFLKEALLLTTLPSFESAPPPLNPIPNVNWFFVRSGLRLISLPVIMGEPEEDATDYAARADADPCTLQDLHVSFLSRLVAVPRA